MEILSNSDLPNMPDMVKTLVQSGVYSLFQIDATDAAYVLVTSDGDYFLTVSGDVIENPVQGKKQKTAAVTFGGQGSSVGIRNSTHIEW